MFGFFQLGSCVLGPNKTWGAVFIVYSTPGPTLIRASPPHPAMTYEEG